MLSAQQSGHKLFCVIAFLGASMRVTILVCIALIAISAVPSSLAQDQSPPKAAPLPDADQDQVTEAIIVYSKNPKTYLGANGVKEGYLGVSGHDPSPALISKLEADGFTFKPASQFKAGDGYIIGVSVFASDSSNTVSAELRAWCGGTCGVSETYNLRRVSISWIVGSFHMNWIS